MEILSANVYTNHPHVFTFSDNVKQFIVGFSSMDVHYSEIDHHVRDIEVDLQNVQKCDNNVTVTPVVRISDRHDTSESYYSTINVVVIALVGEGNPDIYMLNRVKVNENFELPWDNLTFIQSSLTHNYVSYWETDHHLEKYYSLAYPKSSNSPFMLQGETFMTDRHYRNLRGVVSADVIAYCGIDKQVLCCSFNSNNSGRKGSVCFGEKPENFKPEDYELACIINGYEVSFNSSTDHHVYQIKLSSKIENDKLYEKVGKVYANINLTAYLEDSSKNCTDIQHNKLYGFVIAYNKNKPEEKQYNNYEEFADEYNRINSSFLNQ